MLKRQTRQRREFLYKKALEARERQIWEKKQAVKDALAKGKPVPTELKKELDELREAMSKDAGNSEPLTHVDDEYDRAGIEDPKILITTSRNPSSKLLQFSKELRLVFPNAHRVNRGKYVMGEIASACRANGMTDLIMIHEHRGIPDAMVVSHFPHGPTVLFTLHNVLLRHDVPSGSTSTVSEQYPHLIFDGFSSKLGSRIMSVLKYLFPVPRDESTRVMTFQNQSDFISFRHHVFVKSSHKEVQLAEVGPRFDLRPYEIRQGTVEQKEADLEWVLRPYQRTARKRKQL
ncbi:snoRNA-binding rRNA-processing protein imp4 [Puccinia graminis f. sp. tritici]|uniref:U3 small nucleolar ribonucleoprotein protein IMP4 n=1 Tax=Puccinia graminis f. sp. tritici TaxID=56615 RepID=A0A5B0MRD5_PUCGR|nr:snoRNA-binding rRNA-processing protein imp4 [Puccinia graminis f. sp. tritici]